MNVSVIIPTYNGAGKILACLDAINKQTFRPNEIIVVIDGSKDNTLDLLTQVALLQTNLLIHYQENKGRAAVRNTGARIAKGDVLVFVDDDMRLQEDVLEQHLKFHKETNSGSVLVGGQIEEFRLLKTDFQLFKYSLSSKWGLKFGTQQSKINEPFITAANFSIPKKIFIELEGFDEQLTDAEDYDLAVRLMETGIQIYYNPRLVGFHDDWVDCKKYIYRQSEYRKSHRKLAELYPQRHQKMGERIPAFHCVKKIIFGSSYWVEAIDDEFFLLRNLPKKIRYKIYDWVITTQSIGNTGGK